MTPRAAISVLLVGAMCSAGCGEATSLDSRAPDTLDPGGPRETPPSPSIWVESFDHRGQLAELEGSAILDSNRGLLTLPRTPLSELAGSGRLELGAPDGEAGLVQGEDLVVTSETVLEAPDALELQAAGTIRLAGTLRAGEGGIVVQAGRAIQVEATALLEATGPIRLLIASVEGEVRIAGTIRGRSSGLESAGTIEIGGRGAVSLDGAELVVDDVAGAPGPPAPSIRIGVYGDIRVASLGASVTAGPRGRVEVAAGQRFALSGTLVDDADWTIGASELELAPDALLDTGRLTLIAERTVTLGSRARLRTRGPELAVLAHTVRIGTGARLIGEGPAGTSLRVEASRTLLAEEGASLVSLTPSCRRTGQVVARIGGPYVGLGRAALQAAPNDASCPDADPSAVVMVAHRYEGVLPEIAPSSLAYGPPRIDEALRVTVPPTTARTAGRWTSKPLPAEPVTPRLQAIMADLPDGTGLSIALGVADGPEDICREFIDFDPVRPEIWSVHSGAEWWVVRVELAGRRYDAPVLDHVELRPPPL